MCGIFFLKYLQQFSADTLKIILGNFDRIKHRGPDRTEYVVDNENTFIGFHRLAINGLSEKGDQPFVYDKPSGGKIYVICNGEIYNYRDLNKRYDLGVEEDDSDCAVLYPLFEKLGIEKMITKLDGVYAFVIYDSETGEIWAGRDPIGVRPLFWGTNEGNIGFASEAKALIDLLDVSPFPPGSYYCNCDGYPVSFFNIDEWKESTPNPYLSLVNENEIYEAVRNVFTKAVKKRLLSDRPIGSLLSGGLDSSLVASIVQKEMRKQGKNLNTYSIGFKGSPDLIAAQKVADHIGSNHHEVILDMEQIKARLPEIIIQLETWDTTTIRASIGMYFISEYIRKNSSDVVIFSGEGADELCQGYLYFHRQPNDMAGYAESMRLMSNLYLYDVLRADRTTAAHGLELRVPFLDREFMKLITSLPPKKICPRKGIEKYLIRRSFDGMNLLPSEILWRTKEAFSDGVSSEQNNWLDYLKKYAMLVTDEKEFEKAKRTTLHCPPRTREEFYYRKIFRDHYYNDQLITDYWMPKWSPETVDPSARTLKIYSEINSKDGESVESVI